MSPVPTPSPDPFIVQLVSTSNDSAPWWGVPAIAGAFLLIGGLLTYLYTQRNDRKKADRAQQEKLNDEVVETALAMIAAGAAVRNLALLMLRRKPSEVALRMAKDAMPLTDDIAATSRRFNITMPPHFKDDFDGYLLSTLVLVSPPFQRPGQELMLNKQSVHERNLVNHLRVLRKIEPLVYEEPANLGSSSAEEMLARGMAQDAEAERIMDERQEKSAPDEGARKI